MNATPDCNDDGATTPQPSFSALVGAPDTARNYGDVLVWPADTETKHHFLFLPRQLTISPNMTDAPHVGMFDAGGLGFFFATVTWQLTPERMELLRRDLTDDDGVPPHLSFAPASVTNAQVICVAQDGSETVIREQAPAPHPPYTAMLQFVADADARPTIMSALEGIPGRLLIRYTITRTVMREHTFTLKGLFPQDTSAPSLDAALERGDLTLKPQPDTAELRAQVLAQGALAQVLHRANANAGQLDITLSDPAQFDFHLTLDVGRRIAAHLPINDPLPPE